MVLFMGLCMAPARSMTGCDDIGVARGLSLGQCNLGVAYAEGKGIPQDWVLAHKWFNILAINRKKGRRYPRYEVERKMTAERFAKKRELACEWKRTHSK